MTDIFGSLINGEWDISGPQVKNVNPSDVSTDVGAMANGDAQNVSDAVGAARAAQPAWAATKLEERKNILHNIGQELIDRCDEIGTLLSREEGKPFAEGRGETYRAGEFYQYYAAECLRQIGESAESVRPGIHIDITREAVGVVGLITPWNFPICIPAWKMAPALAYGNTIVLKPSEITPATSYALADVLDRHLPKGVFNMVQGGGDVGAALSGSKDVDAISFTGSVSTGRKIAQAAVQNMARIQCEMGSKNPMVVMDDADMDLAVAQCLHGAFGASGQKCTASSRLIVHEKIHDEFVEKLSVAANAKRVGHALEEGTELGPVVTEGQMDKILGYMQLAKDEGGELITGGERLQRNTEGYYLPPTIYTGLGNDARVNREEVFGPMTCVIKVGSYEEGLATANDTEFGLAASIMTSGLKAAEHFKRNATFGSVLVNLATAGLDYHVPFGGRNASSYGPREQGEHAKDFYTIIKTAYTNPG
ncbi:MAG: aldehyde dehydrogenase family protein [Acidimicrobiales bacterium]|nr:aldehyde dehydrogenase family protein [Hyphomonadaceae bacterium]RZV44641.1 MAG: aldehyde dehydrogenase family protein [Acidimicrobiales bacterium]